MGPLRTGSHVEVRGGSLFSASPAVRAAFAMTLQLTIQLHAWGDREQVAPP